MKNDSIDNIRLDLNREKVHASISVRYGDTKTRSLHCMLVNGGSLVKLDNALFAELLIKKADGKEADQNMVIYENELQYTWRTQDVNALGENICQVMVTFEDGSVITSPEFSLYVYSKVLDQRMQESMNEYTAITQQLVDAKKYSGDAGKSADMAEQYMQSANSTYDKIIEDCDKYVEEITAIQENARLSETNAKQSEINAKSSEESAGNTLTEINRVTELYLQNINGIKSAVESLKDTADTYAQEAMRSKNDAAGSAELAGGYSESAGTYANSANESAENARLAASEASENAQAALEYKNAAAISSENAAVSEQNADAYQKKAKEYLDQMGEGKLILGETETTAFRGDHGKAAYDHSLLAGNPHGTTYSQVGADKAGASDEALASAKGYADEKMTASYQNATAYTDQQISYLINGAPEDLDTLKEIADAMEQHRNVMDALNEAIGKKANASELQTHESNETIHITASEREKWNEITTLKEKVELLIDMIGYPYTPITESEV